MVSKVLGTQARTYTSVSSREARGAEVRVEDSVLTVIDAAVLIAAAVFSRWVSARCYDVMQKIW